MKILLNKRLAFAFAALLALGLWAPAPARAGVTTVEVHGVIITGGGTYNGSGGGTATWDPVTNTMTLDHFVDINNTGSNGIYILATDDITLHLTGHSQLTVSNLVRGVACEIGNGNILTIQGGGSLTVARGSVLTSIGGNGVYSNGSILLEDVTLRLQGGSGGSMGNWGGAGLFVNTDLRIRGGRVDAFGGNGNAASAGNGITVGGNLFLEGGTVTAQMGAGTGTLQRDLWVRTRDFVASGGSFRPVNDVLFIEAGPPPHNLVPQNVYPATLTLEASPGTPVAAGTPVTALSPAPSPAYGLTDVGTDTDGRIYPWLPQGTTLTQITAGGRRYGGSFTMGAAATSGTFTLQSNACDITGFTIPGQVGSTAITDSGAATGSSIALTMPLGTDVRSLTPSITVSPLAAVSPLSGAAQDFTNPVLYTVTAQDGSTKTYVVTVTVQPPLSSDKDIIGFTLPGQVGSTAITDSGAATGSSIALTMPFGTGVRSLTPSITASPGATVSPLSGAAADFTNPVPYTVTAQDGSTKTYVVTVTVQPPPRPPSRLPQTGDGFPLYSLLGVFGAALAGGGWLGLRRRVGRRGQ